MNVLKRASTLVQAIGLVYLIGLGMILFAATLDFGVRGAIELVSWVTGFGR